MSNEDSQSNDTMNQEMSLVEVEVEGKVVPNVAIAAKEKPEVKLEDLFADIESDEELPSSTMKGTQVSSSSEAASSPL